MNKSNGPIYCDPAMLRSFVHGQRKSEIVQRVADGHITGSFLNVPTGMSETNPLKSKGKKIMSSMKHQYGKEKGKQVFYASKNKGIIKGVD